jgi:chromate transporter
MISFKQYWLLSKSTFLLSAFTLGGGLVMVPLMQKKFVDELKWIEQEEMIDIIALAQACPGVFAINASILIGKKIAGFIGSLISMISTILPPLIIMGFISLFYDSLISNKLFFNILLGMQGVIAAIILSAGISLFNSIILTNKRTNIILFISYLCLYLFIKINIIYLIIFAIIIALITYLTRGHHDE